MERELGDSPERAVQCCGCHLLVKLPSTAGLGDVLTCPICATRMVLRELTVYIAEPVVEA
jgi:hypothetical protein